MAEKISKDAADYGKGMMSSHCGKMFDKDGDYCQHFISLGAPNPGECSKVKGIIKRDMWCRLYKKAVTK